MNKEDIYKLLEDKFPTYKDLSKVTTVDNGEPLLSLRDTGVHYFCFDERMKQYTNEDVYVRQSLIYRLLQAQAYLYEVLPGHVLVVGYGYRHLSIQEESFEKIKAKILKEQPNGWTEETLREHASYSIAVPDVAGHPTGGAIDILVKNPEGAVLDMGTNMHEFTRDSYVYSPFISKEVWLNRQKLRYCMVSAGFAPFDGEWWHFSYGDKEWAFYYGKPNALYDQLYFTSV